MEKYTKDFPFFKAHPALTYLDSATTSHKPESVIRAMSDFYAHEYASTYRSLYDVGERATEKYEAIRALCGRFIGARYPSEIAFTRGATEGINILASSWGAVHIKQGDEIIISEVEHHANILPWQRLARMQGAVIRWLKHDPKELLGLNMLDELISSRTKLIAVTGYSNVLGSFPGGHERALALVIRRAHSVGARVLVDAAQLAPHVRLNVEGMGCDFMVFSAHKMMGPQGVGVLYVKRELHGEFEPYQLGGGMVADVGYDYARWRSFPYLLEAGTQAVAQVIGFGAALDYLMQVDLDALQKHEALLCSYLIDRLKGLSRVTILGPQHALLSGDHLVSFIIDGIHAHDVSAYLNARGICVRAGNQCAQILHKKLGISASVRASFYLYNTFHDVDKLVKAVAELCGLL